MLGGRRGAVGAICFGLAGECGVSVADARGAGAGGWGAGVGTAPLFSCAGGGVEEEGWNGGGVRRAAAALCAAPSRMMRSASASRASLRRAFSRARLRRLHRRPLPLSPVRLVRDQGSLLRPLVAADAGLVDGAAVDDYILDVNGLEGGAAEIVAGGLQSKEEESGDFGIHLAGG